MKKFLSLLWCCCVLTVVAFAQSETDTSVRQKDTTPQLDSVIKTVVTVPDTAIRPEKKKAAQPRIIDSAAMAGNDSVIAQAPVADTTPKRTEIRKYAVSVAAFEQALRAHPYYNFFGTPLKFKVLEKKVNDKDALFYFLLGLMLYMGFIKLLFEKYLANIMTLFFRATLRQQQIREQLLQAPLPSLLLNILFLFSGGLFATFSVIQYKVVPDTMNFWLLLGYCMALLLIIYLGKFMLLKITGWIFNVTHATDTYIFIVFLVNKIIGIFLLPVVVLLAFPYPPLYPVVFTLAFIMLVLLYGYRFIISYKPIRNEIKVGRLHFFVYLCAFEIAPLLLIYKVLLIFVERSY